MLTEPKVADSAIPDKRATTLATQAAIGNLLNCHDAIYPQKEQQQTRQTHLTHRLQLTATTHTLAIINTSVVRLSTNSLENGTRRRRSNFELFHSYKEFDIANFIKIQQIKWAGHVVRMDEDRTTKKSSMPYELAHGEEKSGQILDGLMA
ncbi:hypothetical protein TNCV_5113421 [Trichonephila clavipes]|nr:hypothetical protein TNCV_5113421 [Trichonephila clavipes]